MFQFLYDPKILAIATGYLKSLDKKEFSKNLTFVEALQDKPGIYNLAMHYINLLSKKELYQKENIYFFATFTHLVTDNGFDFFYESGHKIDSILGVRNYSQNLVEKIISNAVLLPELNRAKRDKVAPDFTASRT